LLQSVSGPEAKARESIDAQLRAAGWAVQDIAKLNKVLVA
jgi:type I site-specific restriction endonuclease